MKLRVVHTETKVPITVDEHDGRRRRTLRLLDNSLIFHIFKHFVHLSLLGQRECVRELTVRTSVASVEAMVNSVCPPIIVTLSCEDVL